MKTRILALLGQARLFHELGHAFTAELCLAEAERLLPSVVAPQDFLNLYLAMKKVELYLLPDIEVTEGDQEDEPPYHDQH